MIVDRVIVGPTFAKEILELFKDMVGKDLCRVGERYPVAKCGIFDGFMEDFVMRYVFGVGMTTEELMRNMKLRVTFPCGVPADEDVSKKQKSYR